MMKLKDLSFVLVRVLALYTIIQGLQHIVNIIEVMYPFFMMNLKDVSVGWIFITSLIAIFLLVLGVFVWIKAAWVVGLMNGDHDMNPEEIQTVKNNHWYTLGLTLVGIYLFVDTLPNLISLIGQLIQYARMNDLASYNMERERNKVWLQIGVITLKLLLAIVLVLRASGLARLLRKIRGEKSVDEN